MSSNPSSSNALPGRSAEYLKTLESRVKNGKTEFLLRFRIEGQEDLEVWRSAEALKKDRPLLRAFLQSRKTRETKEATPIPQPEPGKAVDCVICYSFVIEDQSHDHTDVCAECWAKIRDVPRSERIEQLSKARADFELSQQMSSLHLPAEADAAGDSVTNRARSVRVRGHHAPNSESKNAARVDKYWSDKQNGICTKHNCTLTTSGGQAACRVHQNRRRERYENKTRSGICGSCSRPSAPDRSRCEYHLNRQRIHDAERKRR